MDIKEYVEKTYAKINGIEDPVEYTKGMTTFLSQLHPSDAYTIIRDKIAPKKSPKIQKCKVANVQVYQEFQDLERKCKESHDHDNRMATNLDVDKAVSKSYGITTRMIRAVMDMEKARFDKVTKTINRIEEHLGLDVTDFREGEENDTTEHEDAQNVEGVATEAGESGEAE